MANSQSSAIINLITPTRESVNMKNPLLLCLIILLSLAGLCCVNVEQQTQEAAEAAEAILHSPLRLPPQRTENRPRSSASSAALRPIL